MPGLLPDIDPEGLLEFSVVFTDRSLNHMSQQFQQVMNDLSSTLKSVYSADSVVIVPGGGTYAMEAVARQFAQDCQCLVIRNGWFSFRWNQILDIGKIPAACTTLQAAQINNAVDAPFAPAPIDEVVATIKELRPQMVFAPHVETASGIMLPDDYIKAVGEAVKEVGGLFVLDCIASGAMWVDMKACQVDVLISAPQKGWSASPCSGLVMLNQRALDKMEQTTSNSFACDLKKWWQIMQAYENGGHAYHATLPTDALKRFRDIMLETVESGLNDLKAKQAELGRRARQLFADHGHKSVAAPGFEAPGVAVFYAPSDTMKTGKPFLEQGLQIAAGVPLQCDEPDSFRTFRIGLFGLEKLRNVERTLEHLKQALDNLPKV